MTKTLSVLIYIPYTNVIRDALHQKHLLLQLKFRMSYRCIILTASPLIYQCFNYHTFSEKYVSLFVLGVCVHKQALQSSRILCTSLGALLLVAVGRFGKRLRGIVPEI